MSLILEYCQKSPVELEQILLSLIQKYNKLKNTYLMVYFTASNKGVQAMLEDDDYYVICDILRNVKQGKIDILLETPGGSGETVERIVDFLRTHFEKINFVICGKAMSAGTILTLSGDEISMTETASLGPIDAQMRIGRSQLSAFDYISWVEEKSKEAERTGRLNPVDATIAAQITPGELNGVIHAKEYAEDLVKKWLPKYKFKNWNQTKDSNNIVSEEMKIERAEKIAKSLTDHSNWRTHGRPLNISELEKIGLQINSIDSEPEIADIVYRVDIICRLLTGNTPAFKIFATELGKILKNATMNTGIPINLPFQNGDLSMIKIDYNCQKCGKPHLLYAKLKEDEKLEKQLLGSSYKLFPKNCRLQCSCGFENDLTLIKNDIEKQTGKTLRF